MNEDNRGKIRNREYASRLRDFSGLLYGKITPTDIDAFIDFQDKVFIFIEAKHGESMPPFGQRLALERLCDACQKSGRESIVLIASHSADGDIQIAVLPVTFIRYRSKWRRPRHSVTVREAIDGFLSSAVGRFSEQKTLC